MHIGLRVFKTCWFYFVAKIFSLLPDYVLPYAIHLLAHDPELTHHQEVVPLKNIKEWVEF